MKELLGQLNRQVGKNEDTVNSWIFTTLEEKRQQEELRRKLGELREQLADILRRRS